VTHVNSSTQAKVKLLNQQKGLQEYNGKTPQTVVTPVVTRWWSYYDCFERGFHLRWAIHVLQATGELGTTEVMGGDDWKNIGDIVSVLAPFKEAMKFLEGEKYVTASWVLPMVKRIRDHLTPLANIEEESIKKTMASVLLKDFEKRWGKAVDPVWSEEVQRSFGQRQIKIHPRILVAYFLDPRFKTLSHVHDTGSKIAIRNSVKLLMVEIMEKNAPTTETGQGVVAAAPPAVGDNDIYAQFEAEMETHNDNPTAGNDVAVDVACETELKLYNNLPRLQIQKGANPLDWWKSHEVELPTLAAIARSYLAIQATSAPSERIFSAASRLITGLRNNLDPETVTNLMWINRNWEWYKDFGAIPEAQEQA
jgi:hypothetical protein